MLSLLGPFGVPNESRYLVDCSSGGRAPASSTTCGANIATSISKTMNTSAAIATLSLFSRRQNSWRGERAAISVVADTPPPGAGPRVPASPPSSERSGTPVVTRSLLSTGLAAAPLCPLLRQCREAHVPGRVRLVHHGLHVGRLDERRLVPVPRDRDPGTGHLPVDRGPRLGACGGLSEHLGLAHRLVDGRVVQLRPVHV